MSMTVSGKQLAWLKEELERYQDKQFIIVQGHVPVVGPVRSKNSSANMLEGGTTSEFWKTMVDYGVDLYLCGEHHRITAKQHDGIWQIVHGAYGGVLTHRGRHHGCPVVDGPIRLSGCKLKPSGNSTVSVLSFRPANFDYRYPIGSARSMTGVVSRSRTSILSALSALLVAECNVVSTSGLIASVSRSFKLDQHLIFRLSPLPTERPIRADHPPRSHRAT